MAEDLRFGDDRLAAAEKTAAKAREGRDKLEGELREVSLRRSAAEERFADRDRERTAAWGLLTRLRAAAERIGVRAAGLGDRASELERRIEALEAELGPLTLEVSEGGAPGDRARHLEEELTAIDSGLAAAQHGLERARAEGSEASREAGLGSVRSGAEQAARHARRAEGLLGERHRERMRSLMSAETELLDEVRRAATAVAGVGEALRARAEEAESRVVGGDDGDAIAEEMKACSAREFEIQAQLKAASDELTRAEVEAAHIGDRRGEAAKELARIASRLDEEVPLAEQPLTDEERAEIDKRLERLERRRSQIGPVNPLAQQEYDEAVEHVEDLQAQREDAERAMHELQSLIRDIDREIERAFEETFERTATNFEEMVDHLFPGGRGRLRRVSLRPVRDAEDTSPAGEAAEGSDEEDEEEEREGREELGVEIEVTPAGKSTRRLSLLSGGEKSLVALAFVFAVFLARPCPFYILDEVEAALDDANIDRFLQLVRRFSNRAQFVVVTHQKRTMDAADVLYGVSMGGDGVTKVISRRLPREEQAELEGEQPEAEPTEAPRPFAGLPAEDEPAEGIGVAPAAREKSAEDDTQAA